MMPTARFDQTRKSAVPSATPTAARNTRVPPLPAASTYARPGAEQEPAGGDEIDRAPDHLIGDLHGHQGHQQQDPRSERDTNDVLALRHDRCHVLSENSRRCLDEQPKNEPQRSPARITALAKDVVEGLLHAFAEALAVRLRVEAKQARIDVPVTRSCVHRPQP